MYFIIQGAYLEQAGPAPVSYTHLACISVVIYTIVSRIVYPQLDAYNGLDQMGKIDLIRLPRLILRSYKWVVQYFILKPFSFVTAAAWALNVASCLLTAGLVIAFFIRKKIYKNSGSAILYIFLAMMVPLAMGSIIIMAPDALSLIHIFHVRCAVTEEGIRTAGVELSAVMIHFFQILGTGGEKFRVFAADSAVFQNNAPLWRIGKRNYRHDGFGLVKKCHGIFQFFRRHKGGGGIDAAEPVSYTHL